MGKMNKNRDKEPKRWVPVVDGGYGWIVVIGSFFVHVFADGIVYSFGVLLERIMNHFNESNAKSSIIISLLTGLTLSSGPIASALTNKFGCRVTTITGSLIATIGCAASYFASSVEYLMVTVGCIMGIGFGLMYCPAIVIVTMYFEKKRALATGIAVCGAGVGTVLFAPISKALIGEADEQVNWKRVFLVYAGFVLMCSLCGATFRPISFVPAGEDEEELKELNGKDKEITKNGNTQNDFPIRSASVLIPRSGDEEKALLDGQIRSAFSNNEVNGKALDGNGEIRRARSLGENWSRRRRTISESTGFINVKDVFYSGSVKAIPDYNENRDKYRSLTSLQKGKSDIQGMDIVNENDDDDDNDEKEPNKMREIYRTIVKMTDLKLLLDPLFLLFAISNFLTSIAFNSPLVFLPTHATNIGCDGQQAAKVVSMFGLMNTLGRILFGLVSDRKFPTKYGKDTARNRLWIYNISLTICGIFTCLVFICWDFYSLSVYSGLFGLTLSSYVCLTSVLLVDLIGLDRLTNAFGLLLLFQGIGTIVGPPIAGKLADITGGYVASFIFCGISLLISGLMLFAIPKIKTRKSQEKLNS